MVVTNTLQQGEQGTQGDESNSRVTVLVPTSDYVKNGPFRVVGVLQTNLSLDLMRLFGVPSEGNYLGYVIHYTFAQMPYFSVIFVNLREEVTTLTPGERYTFCGDPTFFTGQGEWVRTTVHAGQGNGC